MFGFRKKRREMFVRTYDEKKGLLSFYPVGGGRGVKIAYAAKNMKNLLGRRAVVNGDKVRWTETTTKEDPMPVYD